MKYFTRIGDTKFTDTVNAYQLLYEQFENDGNLHILEVLTAEFNLHGAVDLINSDVNLNILVPYALLTFQRNFDHLVYHFYVFSSKTQPLFITSDIELENLQNRYEYCIDADDQLYWECSSSGSLQVNNKPYWLTVNKRRLTMSEMWHEITTAMQQGHELRDAEYESLTRTQMIHGLHSSKY